MGFIENLRNSLANTFDSWGGQSNTAHLSQLPGATSHEPHDYSVPGYYQEKRAAYLGGKVNRDTLKSLRSGEDYNAPSGPSGRRTTYTGGIGQGRFLGHGVGDVLNPEYFADYTRDTKIDSSQKFSLSTPSYRNVLGKDLGSMTVGYDQDGSIAEITIDSDMGFGDGKYKKGDKIRGSGEISQFFNDMGIAKEGSQISVSNHQTSIDVGTGSKNGYWAPTNIFGSKGIFSGSKAGKFQGTWDRWNTVGFGTEKGYGRDSYKNAWTPEK